MGEAGALLRAGRIDAFQHLRIDGSFIVREEEFQVARRGACFRFREPVNQFVNLLLGRARMLLGRTAGTASSRPTMARA